MHARLMTRSEIRRIRHDSLSRAARVLFLLMLGAMPFYTTAMADYKSAVLNDDPIGFWRLDEPAGDLTAINIGSLGGYVAAPLAIPYAATKAGLDAATRGMRLELAPWRIRVSLVIPGFVDTAVFENARKDSQHLRDDPKNPYRKLFVDLDEFTQKSLKSALAPDDVAKVVVIAATVRRPRLRYYTPVSTRLQTGFLGMLPESLLDRILLRLYKIEVPGRSAPYPSKGSGSTAKRSQ